MLTGNIPLAEFSRNLPNLVLVAIAAKDNFQGNRIDYLEMNVKTGI
jgi:hypothetical protein